MYKCGHRIESIDFLLRLGLRTCHWNSSRNVKMSEFYRYDILETGALLKIAKQC